MLLFLHSQPNQGRVIYLCSLYKLSLPVPGQVTLYIHSYNPLTDQPANSHLDFKTNHIHLKGMEKL